MQTIGLILVILLSSLLMAEEPDVPNQPVKKSSLDERKRKFEALKNELEAFRPATDAAPEEQLAYYQQVIDASTKFAKENPNTAEGFEAASTAALQLAANRRPEASSMAQLAVDAAPLAGVDRKQLATCWVLVAFGKAMAINFPASRQALEKVRSLDEELFLQAVKQIDNFEAMKKAEQESKPK